MLPIFIYGDSSDKTGREICTALSKTESFFRITNSGFTHFGNQPDSFIICETNPIKTNVTNGIAIIKNHISPDCQIKIPDNFPIIVSSDNKAALTLLKNSPHLIITCGMSVTDTISISSKCENSASVSLQRSLVSLNGDVIEECEVPIKLTSCISEYSISAAVALLFLSKKNFDDLCF